MRRVLASSHPQAALAMAVWCGSLLAAYPDDIALSWDEVDHAGAVFHYKAFFDAALQGNVRRWPWTEFGAWGAGVGYYPPAVALLWGLTASLFGVHILLMRVVIVVQAGIALLLLYELVRLAQPRGAEEPRERARDPRPRPMESAVQGGAS